MLQQRQKLPIDPEVGKLLYKVSVSSIPDLVDSCPMCIDDEVFLWAYSNVISRSFSISRYSWNFLNNVDKEEISGPKDGYMIVPFIDYFNHMFQPLEYRKIGGKSGLVYSNEGFISLHSDRNFAKNEEVFIDYGEKSNINLLIVYGFVVEENLDDSIVIKMEKRGKKCPDGTVNETEIYCIFKNKITELNCSLLKTIMNESNEYEFNSAHQIQKKFMNDKDSREKILSGVNDYRNQLKSGAISRCLTDLRTVENRLKQSNYTNYRYNLIDTYCKASHWSYYRQLELVDQLLLWLYQHLLIKS